MKQKRGLQKVRNSSIKIEEIINLPLVKLTWVDSVSVSGWTSEVPSEHDDALCEAIGRGKKGKAGWLIFHVYSISENSNSFFWWWIPVGCVKKAIYLTEKRS